MVMRIIFFCLTMPLVLFAGEFNASVSRNQVNLGEGFTLTLTLKDASAKVSPSIVPLLQTFKLSSQHQSANTVIYNGKMNVSTSWKFVLVPIREGDLTIPSITLETSEGILATAPITIQVVKGGAADRSNTEVVKITTEVSNSKPYKNEPVFFTVRLTSQQPLVNIQPENLVIEDAIVEPDNEPRIYEKVIDGINVGIIEFNYLITPLKAGQLIIPSHVVQGGMPIIRKIYGLQGFEQLKPFALSTEETVLDVQPAVAGIDPWLPATSLTIEELWDDNQKLQVGEFFTRGIKITAEGISSSQLPNLTDMQGDSAQFKIYADKPEVTDQFKYERVLSSRKENYTLIPLKEGILTLPEIVIVWWDVKKNKKMEARLPARSFNVLPASEVAMNETKVSEVVKNKEEVVSEVAGSVNPILYVVIGALTVLLVLVLSWAVALQMKMRRLLKPLEKARPVISSKPPKTPKSRHETLSDLNPT